MKSKIKKYIKRCTIFLTIFTLVFSSCCFSSAALGDNSNGLSMNYSITPKLQRKNTNTGEWVDVADFDGRAFVQSPDGSVDKVIYSWTGLYGLMKPDTSYRILFRFNLIGPNASQYDLSFNSYFDSCIDHSTNKDNPSKYIIYHGSEGVGGSKSQYFSVSGGGSSSYTVTGSSTLLSNRKGELFSFNSRDQVFDEYKEQYPNTSSFVLNFYTIGIPFQVSRDVISFSYVLDNFSAELFFDSPSDKEFTDYEAMEDDILNATAGGRNEATNLFGGFGSLSTFVAAPVMAAGKVVGRFFVRNEFLNTLMRFSLSLGIFGFLVGMAVSVGGYFSSKSSRAERKASNSERSAYYRAGTAYYKSRTKK